jgi:hypothetical protein
MAKVPSYYMGQIQRNIHSEIIAVLASVDKQLVPESTAAANLGGVKDFGVAVQQAQRKGVPLSDLLGGGEAWNAFRKVADKIRDKTE